tara:strand:- start:244 stop:402 length:159 start_codon:yes stop_codon:yes gene_type:complete
VLFGTKVGSSQSSFRTLLSNDSGLLDPHHLADPVVKNFSLKKELQFCATGMR